MTSPSPTPPDSTIPRPTLFLSYASEDRAAVRLLRDALAATGLEVWYDENELTGGDAWDQKIRRQIRECDYFMPIISASTERRREGYFRREWRLAVERTLDMADDVMFLLPVSIDDTSESHARVPEKFLSVQWLRAPGGAATPALHAVAHRLATGHHPAPIRPRSNTHATTPAFAAEPPPMSSPAPQPASPPVASAAPVDHPDAPPPMPAFPKQHGQDLGGVLKFLAEVIWWVVSAIWLLLRRAPRWMRLLIVLWAVLSFISYCTRDKPESEAPRTKKTAPRTTVAEPVQTETTQMTPAELQAHLQEAKKALQESGLPAAWAQFGTEIAGRLGAEIKRSAATGKQLVAVPFTPASDDAANEIPNQIFDLVWDRLVAARPQHTALITTPLSTPADATLVALGQRLQAAYVLGARVVATPGPAPEFAPARSLQVSLLKVEDGTLAWNGEFPLAGTDAAATSRKIAEGILAALPRS